SLQPANRCSSCNTQAETGHSERVIATAIRQDAAAATGTHHQARLHQLDPDIAGSLRERWCRRENDREKREHSELPVTSLKLLHSRDRHIDLLPGLIRIE